MTPKVSTGELLLAKHLKELKLRFETEYRFDKARRWRADFYLPDSNILIEAEGGTYQKSRHGYGMGFAADCVKYSTAAMMGFRVIRFTTEQIERGQAKQFLKDWLGK